MKKLYPVLALMLSSLSYGQITTMKVVTKPASPGIYDSLENYLGENFQLYLGQELYLKGVNQELRKFGYSNFMKDIGKDILEGNNIYKGEKNEEGYILSSSYSEMAGKYFKVLKVINTSDKEAAKHTLYIDSLLLAQDAIYLDSIAKAQKPARKEMKEIKALFQFIKDSLNEINEQAKSIIAGDDETNNKKVFLKLQEKQSGDIVYYKYDDHIGTSADLHGFPFIVVGYFTKLKQVYIGKDFIISGENWDKGNTAPMTDMKTGNPVSNFKTGAKWKCINVAIEEKYYSLSIILQNDKGEQIPLPIFRLINDHWHYVFDASQAKIYAAKFGAENWYSIMERKVQMGWTEDMVELSLGKPTKINIDEYGFENGQKWTAQWIYGEDDPTYYYFDNDKLVAIQHE